MNYNGKIVKKILKLYPDSSVEVSVKQFFDYYYFKCGLSLHEMTEYIIDKDLKNHTTLVMMAKTYGIDIGTKGGNHFKYDRYYSCTNCGGIVILKLLVKNKDRHNNLELKCSCGNYLKLKEWLMSTYLIYKQPFKKYISVHCTCLDDVVSIANIEHNIDTSNLIVIKIN